jgi:hypothetical protein
VRDEYSSSKVNTLREETVLDSGSESDHGMAACSKQPKQSHGSKQSHSSKKSKQSFVRQAYDEASASEDEDERPLKKSLFKVNNLGCLNLKHYFNTISTKGYYGQSLKRNERLAN